MDHGATNYSGSVYIFYNFYSKINSTFKPIFHQNAKYLASGLGVGGNAKIYQHWYILALPPTPNLKYALPPTPTPDASQWNIGGVGSSGVGHVDFMYISCTFQVVCAPFSALATRKSADAKADFSGIQALKHTI